MPGGGAESSHEHSEYAQSDENNEENVESAVGDADEEVGYCHVCSDRVRVTMENEEPRCASCHGSFVELIGEDDDLDNEYNDHEEEEGHDELQTTIQRTLATILQSHGPVNPNSTSGQAPNANANNEEANNEQQTNDNPAASFHALLTQLPENVRTGIQVVGHEGRPIGNLGDFAFGRDFDRIVEELGQQNPGPSKSQPASQNAIDSLPSLLIGDDGKPPWGADGEECCVCYEAFGAKSKCRRMPCEHLFHEKCILPWLHEHNSCPVCRDEVEAGGGSEAGGQGGDGSRNNGADVGVGADESQ